MDHSEQEDHILSPRGVVKVDLHRVLPDVLGLGMCTYRQRESSSRMHSVGANAQKDSGEWEDVSDLYKLYMVTGS